MLPGLISGNWSVAALESSAYEQRVLLADGVVVGFAEFYQVLDECHLLAIAVAPAKQQRGYGRFLLAAVLTEVTTRGCVTCLLEVRASNLAALCLYQNLGFQLQARRPGYYPARQSGDQPEDALLYSCSLPLSVL